MSVDVIQGAIAAAMGVLGGVISVHPPTARAVKVAYVAAFIALGFTSFFFVFEQSRDLALANEAASRAQASLKAAVEKDAQLGAENAQLSARLLQITSILSQRQNDLFRRQARTELDVLGRGVPEVIPNLPFDGHVLPEGYELIAINRGPANLYDVQVVITESIGPDDDDQTAIRKAATELMASPGLLLPKRATSLGIRLKVPPSGGLYFATIRDRTGLTIERMAFSADDEGRPTFRFELTRDGRRVDSR